MEPKKIKCKSKKILWIDDDYFHIKGLAKSLEKEGYKVVPARSYVEATNFLEYWESYCLVILDLIIPYSESAPLKNDISDDDLIDRRENAYNLAENGIELFNYMIYEIKLNIPIIILSVVQHREITNGLLKQGAKERIYKLGLLPNELKRIVIETLSE